MFFCAVFVFVVFVFFLVFNNCRPDPDPDLDRPWTTPLSQDEFLPFFFTTLNKSSQSFFLIFTQLDFIGEGVTDVTFVALMGVLAYCAVSSVVFGKEVSFIPSSSVRNFPFMRKTYSNSTISNSSISIFARSPALNRFV